jgi:hypothetical protein
MGGIQAFSDVLIDLPADPGRLQPLRIGRPAVPELVVGDHRPSTMPIISRPSRPQVVPVRIGRTEHRAVVAIAHRERIGQRIVQRKVRALQVRHTRGGFGRQPPVPVAAVEHLMRLVPPVVEILDESPRQVVGGRRDSGPEWRHHGRAVGLIPDRPAAGKRRRVRVAEPADTAHHAKVLVERPVLLRQHHDVLDILQRATRPVRRDGERASDAVRQHRRRGAAPRELEKPPTTDRTHQHHLSRVHGQPRKRRPDLSTARA